MAKGLGLSSVGGVTANGSPGGIRPMPRPAGLGGVDIEQQPPRQQGGFLARHFGPQGSDTRYKMAMEMLQAAMSGAQGSGSPALAFLAPVMGAVVGAKASDLRDKFVDSEAQSLTEGLLGGPVSPQAQQAMEVLNNPNAPDYLRDIARTMLKDSLVPVGQIAAGPARRSGGGGSRRSGGGGGSSAPARLTYIARDPDGVIRGYNRLTGKREPVPNADTPATPAAGAPADAAPSYPAPPPDPVLPSDPVISADDDLINKYLD